MQDKSGAQSGGRKQLGKIHCASGDLLKSACLCIVASFALEYARYVLHSSVGNEIDMSLSQWIFLIILSVLWGGSFFFVGIAVDHVPALTLVLSRVALAAVILVPIALVAGFRLPVHPYDWLMFAIMAVLNNIIPFSMITLGQTQIASGLASVLNATTPLWAVLIAHAFTHDEKLTANKLSGVLVGIAGVAVLVGPDAMIGEMSSVQGMACIIVATISYGFASLWARRFRTTPPLVSAACQLICSAVLLLPIALMVDKSWLLTWPPAHVSAAIAGLAVFSTALAYILFYHILSVSGPTNAMLVTLLVPVSGILLGTLFLDETLAPQHIAGAFLIMVALIVFDGRLLRFRGSGV